MKIRPGVNAALIRIAQLDAARTYLENNRPYHECILEPDFDPKTDPVMIGYDICLDSLNAEIEELKKLVKKETVP
jgi:hypothetical protein